MIFRRYNFCSCIALGVFSSILLIAAQDSFAQLPPFPQTKNAAKKAAVAKPAVSNPAVANPAANPGAKPAVIQQESKPSLIPVPEPALQTPANAGKVQKASATSSADEIAPSADPLTLGGVSPQQKPGVSVVELDEKGNPKKKSDADKSKSAKPKKDSKVKPAGFNQSVDRNKRAKPAPRTPIFRPILRGPILRRRVFGGRVFRR